MANDTSQVLSQSTTTILQTSQRDARGRFIKREKDTETVPSVALDNKEHFVKVNIEPIKDQDSAQLPAKKSKNAVTKSPYFTPPISPAPSKKGPVTPKKRATSKLIPGAELKEGEKLPQPSPARPPRSPAGIISCIPFPSLLSSTFGLIQERLAHDPFRLLVAVTFLNRTHGKHAIPIFFKLMQAYPTPEALVAAPKEDIVAIIHHLGLQNQRATTYQNYARMWLEEPPAKHKRYPVRNYPFPENPDTPIKKSEVLTDNDPRTNAWEIGHIVQGPYALDSWRIFCRDILRGVATGWNGEGGAEGFQPEWMRVMPKDKELRAFLRWMWMKEGYEWDPETGEKDIAREYVVMAVEEGRIGWDERGGLRVLEEKVELPVVTM